MIRFTYRHHRQDRSCVRTPPSSSPSAPPAPEIAPKIPNARPRSFASPANVTDSIDSAAGASIAANPPCATRAASSSANPFAAPPAADATANPDTPMMNSRLRPKKSQSRPPGSRRLPNARAYPVTTHCRSSVENPRACWAVGSAIFTMVESRMTISWARLKTMRASQRFGPPVRPGAAPSPRTARSDVSELMSRPAARACRARGPARSPGAPPRPRRAGTSARPGARSARTRSARRSRRARRARGRRLLG